TPPGGGVSGPLHAKVMVCWPAATAPTLTTVQMPEKLVLSLPSVIWNRSPTRSRVPQAVGTCTVAEATFDILESCVTTIPTGPSNSQFTKWLFQIEFCRSHGWSTSGGSYVSILTRCESKVRSRSAPNFTPFHSTLHATPSSPTPAINLTSAAKDVFPP